MMTVNKKAFYCLNETSKILQGYLIIILNIFEHLIKMIISLKWAMVKQMAHYNIYYIFKKQHTWISQRAKWTFQYNALDNLETNTRESETKILFFLLIILSFNDFTNIFQWNVSNFSQQAIFLNSPGPL